MMKFDFKIGAGGRLVAKHPEGFVYITPATPSKSERYFDVLEDAMSANRWKVTTSFDTFASPVLNMDEAKAWAERTYGSKPERQPKEERERMPGARDFDQEDADDAAGIDAAMREGRGL